ncbi:MAG: glycosyl hydrolase family protein, partial [Verrucomicrobia bacterium]|nr:glycosyl hydrolase family protein [Verrucomicrobiota bacterium]
INSNALGMLGVREAAYDYALGRNIRFAINTLNPAKKYRLTFFSSRRWEGDTGTTFSVFSASNTVTATNGDTVFDPANRIASGSLNHRATNAGAQHNQDTVLALDRLSPTAGGSLYVSFAGSEGGVGAMNAMSIEESQTISPVLTSTSNASGTVGVPFSYQISATNDPTSFGAVGLPAGLTNNPVTGLISGTPTMETNALVQISAANSAGTASTTIAIQITASTVPLITSAPSVARMYNSGFSYQIVATGGATRYTATGLPTGLSLDANSGLISGSLSNPTNTTVQISAINSAGTNTISLQIEVTGQEFLVDFGQTPTTNAVSGKIWNNWTNGGQYIPNLVDSAGTSTGYNLDFSTPVSWNTNFGVVAVPSLGVFNEGTVVTDGVFTTDSTNGSTVRIRGLNRTNAYTFQLFGSRDASDTRAALYTLTGSNVVTGTLTNSGANLGGSGVNHNTNILTLTGVMPDRDGQVLLNYRAAQGGFGYLNAIRIISSNFPAAASTYLGQANRWVDQDALNPAPSNALLFLGSSSIRRWESLTRDFADYQVIQRGMGGATFGDINQLANDLVYAYNPRAVVMWAGVNDLYAYRSGAYVFQQFTEFVGTFTNRLPNAKLFYLGITRNPEFAGTANRNTERTNANALISGFIATNGNANLKFIDLPAFFDALQDTTNKVTTSTNDLWYYQVDNAHLNARGYEVWKNRIRSALAEAGISPDRPFWSNGSAPAAGQRVLFDFGPADGTNGTATLGVDTNGNQWNNWHAVNGGSTVVAGEHKAGLVDSTGAATGLVLRITGDFGVNGRTNGGLTNIPSQALGYLGVTSATEDYFSATSDAVPDGGDDNVPGGLMISGLNPGLTYDLRFLASCSFAATRQTRYDVYGASSNTITLRSSGAGIGVNRGDGNDQTLATVTSVKPNPYGDIFVDVSALSQPSSTNVVAYLNAMELAVVSPYETWARSRGMTPGVNNALVSSNLETFALDGSSMDQASLQGKVRALSTAGSGGQALNLNFPVRRGASFIGSTSLSATQDGITYEVLGSSDLINWNLPVELVSAGDSTGLPSLSDPTGYEYRKFRIKDASGTMTRGFLKSTVRSAGSSTVPAVAGKASVSASSYSAMQGVQVQGGVVEFFDGGDWLKYSGVDFGSGATSVTFSASKSGTGGTVEIRLGSPTGRLIGIFTPQDTGSLGNYREQLSQLSGFVSGVQDVYLVASGGTRVCNLQSFRFSQYVLTWSDEFNGTTVNTNNWAVTWNGDVANGELQFYTDRTNNVTVTNGVLRLTAQRENYTGQGPWMSAPKTTAYTSGLIESLNKVQPQYGKIEASMKIPRGAGLWPAFWMMGVNYFTGAGWPLCGEIDIMEYSGASGSFTSAFHTGSYNYMNGGGGVQNVQGFSLTDYDTAFHVYGIEWTPTRVALYVDGKIVLTADKTTMGSSASQWPFNQPFWLKLNLAVGGSYGGDPTSGTFPKTMEVDWVRVYQEQAAY